MEKKVQNIIDKICVGDFNSNDIGMLFIRLRSTFANKSELRDLADTIAHNEGRNKGASFEYIHSFINNLISLFEQRPGTMVIPQPPFKRAKIIEELIKILRALNIDFDETIFREREKSIISCLLDSIDDTEIIFKPFDSKIVKCYLKRDEGQMYFCINLNINGFCDSSATHRLRLFD